MTIVEHFIFSQKTYFNQVKWPWFFIVVGILLLIWMLESKQYNNSLHCTMYSIQYINYIIYAASKIDSKELVYCTLYSVQYSIVYSVYCICTLRVIIQLNMGPPIFVNSELIL